MPVQTGFGSPDLDMIVDINGFSLRIETKVDGKRPSPRQLRTIAEIRKAGTPVLIIDQDNLIDVVNVVGYLMRGQQIEAFEYADDSRECYTEK